MVDAEPFFLRDAAALAWIVTRLDPAAGERAAELGAGAGTIAAALSQVVAASDLTLVELDARLGAGLRAAFPAARVIVDDWRRAWPRVAGVELLVVSLPSDLAHEALATVAASARPPRAIVAAVAADVAARPPAGFRLLARRPLPGHAFVPPQPFASEAWHLVPRLRQHARGAGVFDGQYDGWTGS